MNATFSIPTGNRRDPFENVTLTEGELLEIVKHPRLKEASSLSIFTEKGDDPAQVGAIAKRINEMVEFKGDIRTMTTRSGATLYQLTKRASVSAARLFATLCEGQK